MKEGRKINHMGTIICLLLVSISLHSQPRIWVGSWSCAPYAAGQGNTAPAPYLAENTLRQVLRVSIGGDSLRMKFSNKSCATPVTMQSVKIAVSAGGSAIEAASSRTLTFEGDSTVTLDPFGTVTSDPIAFPLDASMRLAVSIYYGQLANSEDMTSHVASRTDSYIAVGNQSAAVDFNGAAVTAHWYHIHAIDVLAPDTSGSVAIIGNSITDGYGLSGGLQNRWTDFFSQELLDDPRTEQVGVLNLGIGATPVAGTSATSGVSRFDEDVLSQSGLRWVIVFYGVNDIGWGRSASMVTEAFQELIDKAHAHNLKIYGATITPFKGHSYYSPEREAVRSQVNEWIRSPGNFDACIDFDRALRDPRDTARLQAMFSNDGLHPSVAGYEELGKSVDRGLFTHLDHAPFLRAKAGPDQHYLAPSEADSLQVTLDGSASYAFGKDIMAYVWSLDSLEIATGVSPSVKLPLGKHHITLRVFDGNGASDSDQVVISILEDAGTWLEAECGDVGSLFQIEADPLASGERYVTVEHGMNSTAAPPPGAAGVLSYSFQVEDGGAYGLYARVICPNADDDSFWLSMDGGSYAMWNNIGPSTSWIWDRYTSDFNLAPGTHHLRIAYREDGAKLDKLWISKIQAELPGQGSQAGNCNMAALEANAGSDTSYCNFDGFIRLGGTPTARGGLLPYSYSWSCLYPEPGSLEVQINELLDNPESSNPLMEDVTAIDDTLGIIVEVQDRFLNHAVDTVELIISSLLAKEQALEYPGMEAGDSIMISPTGIVHGIAPFSYSWTPESGLSDPSVENPKAAPDSSISYVVEVSDALGCSTSEEITLTVLRALTNTLRMADQHQIRVYPNPLSVSSTIDIVGHDTETLELKVYNALGQLVLQERFNKSYPIGKQAMGPGFYAFVALLGNRQMAHGNFLCF